MLTHLAAIFKIAGALLLFVAGWCYLYKPAWVIRFHAWCRDSLLNDSTVLLSRRKIGLGSIVLSSLLFYSGFSSPHSSLKVGPRIERKMFEEARQAFLEKRYNGAIKRCQVLIRERPNHVDAWQLLGSCWLALGKKAEARIAWQRARAIDPMNAVSRSHNP